MSPRRIRLDRGTRAQQDADLAAVPVGEDNRLWTALGRVSQRLSSLIDTVASQAKAVEAASRLAAKAASRAGEGEARLADQAARVSKSVDGFSSNQGRLESLEATVRVTRDRTDAHASRIGVLERDKGETCTALAAAAARIEALEKTVQRLAHENYATRAVVKTFAATVPGDRPRFAALPRDRPLTAAETLRREQAAQGAKP